MKHRTYSNRIYWGRVIAFLALILVTLYTTFKASSDFRLNGLDMLSWGLIILLVTWVLTAMFKMEQDKETLR